MKNLIACDEAMVEALKARFRQAKTIAEFQRIQCVLLRATLACLNRTGFRGGLLA